MPTETESRANRAFLPQPDVKAAASSFKQERNPALDFTKGALVLIMVLYHWMNYFTSLNWTWYRYLHFLTPSFILVSGFLISNVYLSKYRATDPRLGSRLFTRGLKLLVVFVVLNAANIFVLPRLSRGSTAVDKADLGRLLEVFSSGNVFTSTSRAVTFYILVPISYLLLLSAALLLPYRFYKHTFHVACVLFLGCILTLDLNHLPCPNLEFVTIGLLGVLAGFIPIEKVNHFVMHPYVLALAYACYIVAITVWDVPFPLLIVGAFLSVGAIYLAGLRGDQPGKARRHVILLGKYSLLGYIAQIAILRLLSAGLRHVNLAYAVLGFSFFAAFALTMLSVETVDQARAKSTIADRLYKAVFA
jgi:peptidoglycan/LPS O-acetylase OafA/YrhL